MQNSFANQLRAILRGANRWLLKTPDRALDEAYEAALKLKSIEDTHFNGGRISTDYGNYGPSVRSYFQAELRKYLQVVKVRLIEFNASSSVVRLSNQSITEIEMAEQTDEQYRISVINKPAAVLRKLRFIDEVVSKYKSDRDRASAMVIVSDNTQLNSTRLANGTKPVTEIDYAQRARNPSAEEDVESFADKTGVLPRSILRTVDRIKRELDPQAEQEVVENFRSSKARTVVSLRLVLLLILLPLLTQQFSKIFLVGPIVDNLRTLERSPEIEQAFLNIDMEAEAYSELQRYEERLKFDSLIGRAPRLSEEEVSEKLREKAAEIQEKSFQESNNAIKNVFADIMSAVVFALVLVFNKRDLAILRSFIDEMVYGLSDSAKAFIIILFTDIFVGFHSPHGWEVLLEGVAKHFGIAANRDFIFLFIATFPVILDTIFKYWIFRYLNRISPSAVATYRNMNE